MSITNLQEWAETRIIEEIHDRIADGIRNAMDLKWLPGTLEDLRALAGASDAYYRIGRAYASLQKHGYRRSLARNVARLRGPSDAGRLAHLVLLAYAFVNEDALGDEKISRMVTDALRDCPDDLDVQLMCDEICRGRPKLQVQRNYIPLIPLDSEYLEGYEEETEVPDATTALEYLVLGKLARSSWNAALSEYRSGHGEDRLHDLAAVCVAHARSGEGREFIKDLRGTDRVGLLAHAAYARSTVRESAEAFPAVTAAIEAITADMAGDRRAVDLYEHVLFSCLGLCESEEGIVQGMEFIRSRIMTLLDKNDIEHPDAGA